MRYTNIIFGSLLSNNYYLCDISLVFWRQGLIICRSRMIHRQNLKSYVRHLPVISKRELRSPDLSSFDACAQGESFYDMRINLASKLRKLEREMAGESQGSQVSRYRRKTQFLSVFSLDSLFFTVKKMGSTKIFSHLNTQILKVDDIIRKES